MRILIEGHPYPAELVRPILRTIQPLANVEGKIVPNCVGYCYNSTPEVHDCVFILPKVLLKDVLEEIEGKKVSKEKVFGRCEPEQIIHLEENAELPEDDPNRLTDDEVRFIYELAVWIYRAIVVFRDNAKDTSIVLQQHGVPMGRGGKRLSNTFLDILLGLIQFNKDNQDFVFFVLRNIHSGFNKINWTRTISHSEAFIQDGTPIYLNPVNKRKQVNFDEELLIIFFSILQHIHLQYGFPVKINVNFSLLSDSQFQLYLDGYGATRLKQIKYKYFSDKALELWDLCYAFFERSTQVNVEIDQQDYLLVQNFNIVFEAIIDRLIGDTDSMPPELVEQEDGKIVDHMYTYHSLVYSDNDESTSYDEIYYIGDSKYYKIDNPIGKKSVAKQFTYARNVIQWNMRLFLDGKNNKDEIKLRDDELESYNIIPNFFISGSLNKDLDYADDLMIPEAKAKTIFPSRQFLGRLFDRDTLLISHYDVNFLYVVSLYARNNDVEIDDWKERVHEKFRKQIREVLEQHYQFNCMVAKEGINPEAFLKENFKDIIGHVFTPYPDLNGHHFYSFALEKPEELSIDEENRAQKMAIIQEGNQKAEKILREGFEIYPCALGEDIRADILPSYAPCTIRSLAQSAKVLVVMKDRLADLIDKIIQTKKIGIALQGDTGVVLQLAEGFTTAQYLLATDKSQGEVFKMVGSAYLQAKPAPDSMAMTKVGEDFYLVYNLDDDPEISFGEINYENVKKLYATGDRKRNYDSHIVSADYLTKKN